jgi:hypothetical protein
MEDRLFYKRKVLKLMKNVKEIRIKLTALKPYKRLETLPTKSPLMT